MFDAPADAWYVWLGLSAVAAAWLGLAVDLPIAPPPDARGAADSVDRVAAAEPPANARHALGAVAVGLTPTGLSLRGQGGTTHARFGFGPIVPVTPDSRLAAVARGSPPGDQFADDQTFAAAVETAREDAAPAVESGASEGPQASNPTEWRPAGTLFVRHVSWGETDVTLVLAA